ncbi:YybS family protein [Isachenkonia alkalipeptolytica]|nr:YybS family protein [Isachenkonia alkalipeptolytica]
MNLLSDRKALIEASLMATISSFFVISFIYIPFLSLLLILLPVPFLVLATRHGNRYVVYSFFITSVIVGALTGIIYPVFIVLIFGPMTLIMGYFFKRKASAYHVIGVGTLVSILSIFITIQLVDWVAGIYVIDELIQMLQSVIDHQVAALENMSIEAISREEILSYFVIIIPGAFVVQSLLICFLNYYMTAAVLKRLGVEQQELPEFSNFRWPGNIVLGSFIIFTMSFASRFIEGIYAETLLTNITLIFAFVFFLQGIAFISFFIKKTRINKPLRMIILGIIVILSPLLTIVAFMGLVDALFDMRKLKKSGA